MNLFDNYPEEEVVEELQGPWKVQFDPQGGDQASPLPSALQDWTTSSDERVKYYSGEAAYIDSIHPPEKREGETIWLDLGNLTAMAKVRVNGVYAGGAWTPLQGEHHRAGTSGKNQLEVTVVNNWMNRVIGDLNLPKAKRETWSLVNPYNKNSPLQPSGLLGPVTIKRVNY